MNDIKKHALALSLITLLLFLKFILIPLIQWQDNQINTVAMLERKIEKVDNLLLSDNVLNEQYLALSNALSNLEHEIFLYQEESTFQLKQQKIVESNLLKNILKVSSIGWQNTVELTQLPLLQFSLEYRISGKTNNVVEYLTQLKAQDKTPDIQALNFSFRNQNQGKLGSVSARIRVTYYMFKNGYIPYIEELASNTLIINQPIKEPLK